MSQEACPPVNWTGNKTHLKQVEANVLVVTGTVCLLQNGNYDGSTAGVVAVGFFGDRELVLRVVPETR